MFLFLFVYSKINCWEMATCRLKAGTHWR